VGDEGLQHLSGLKSLRWLDLDCTQVSDAGLVHLKGLDLTRLQLYRTNVAGTDLMHLAGSGLELLTLGNVNLTSEAIAELQATMPNCRIDWTSDIRPLDPDFDIDEYLRQQFGLP